MISWRRSDLIAGTVLLGGVLTSCSIDAPGAPQPAAAERGGAVAVVAVEGAAAFAGVPVVVFHQICADACGPGDTYGITRAEFERMMVSVKARGYETISMADFVRAHGGDVRGLPRRPILVTFDDGRLDAYRGADDVLRELGFQATMFVITLDGDRLPKLRMQWSDMAEAAASGRWIIQLHAHAGHVRVPVGFDAAGQAAFGAFYGWRQCDPLAPACASLETFADWKLRAERDIETGDATLASRLGPAAYTSLSFAVPFGDYGQKHSNDARIATELRAFLDARFAVWFTQPSPDPEFMMPSDTVHEVGRYRVISTTTTEVLDAWLTRHAD